MAHGPRTIFFSLITVVAIAMPYQNERAKANETRFTFEGIVEPSRRVVVSNKVTGLVSDVAILPGTRVKAGTVLFQLERVEFELAVAQATAARDEAAATLALTEDVAQRQAALRRRGTGTEAAARQSLLRADVARASLARAEADLALARLNLDRTTITAAIAGVVTSVTGLVGQFVEAEANTKLAEIVQIDPVRVRYAVPHETRQLAMTSTRADSVADMLDRVRITVIEPSGEPHPYVGRAAFESATIDPQSGALTTWATVPNPRGTLLPGLKVRVQSTITPGEGD